MIKVWLALITLVWLFILLGYSVCIIMASFAQNNLIWSILFETRFEDSFRGSSCFSERNSEHTQKSPREMHCMKLPVFFKCLRPNNHGQISTRRSQNPVKASQDKNLKIRSFLDNQKQIGFFISSNRIWIQRLWFFHCSRTVYSINGMCEIICCFASQSSTVMYWIKNSKLKFSYLFEMVRVM